MPQTIFRIQSPFIFTIFGASGDLAKLKIFPSLFALAEQNRFPEKYAIIGYARSEKNSERFRTMFADSVKSNTKGIWTDRREKILQAMLPQVHYFQGQYDQADSFEAYADFRQKILPDYTDEMFYFSTPPQTFVPLIHNLGQLEDKTKIKVIIEKPFGTDRASALELTMLLRQNFAETQIFLLDHYLGKKSVRSILPLRYNNYLLNTLLKGKHIQSVQISALEPFGVEERLGYFDQSGTIRDMIQSHLLQILGLVLMTIPLDKTADKIHREKNNVLEALTITADKNNICTGQYEGYCAENKHICSPFTPTFAAIKLELDREDWHQTPIYLRSGKFVGTTKQSFICIELKKTAHQASTSDANKIIIELSPSEKIHIRFLNENGDCTKAEEVSTQHSIACEGDYCLPEHGLLLLDVLRNAHENFVSFDEIVSCWQLIDKIINFTNGNRPVVYRQNSAGPDCQNQLLEDGASWYGL